MTSLVPRERAQVLQSQRHDRHASRLSWPWLREQSLRNWQFLLVLLAYAATTVVVPVLAPVAISDDWIFTRSVEILLSEGRLHILDISAPYAVFQILWAAPFALLFESVFGPLRLATVTFSLIGGCALYALCRELGSGRTVAALAAGAYLFSPVFLALSYSFMTDPYFTNLLVLSALFLVRGTRRLDEGAGVRNLLVGSLFAGFAFLERSQGLLIPVAAVLVLLASRSVRWNAAGLRVLAAITVVPAAIAVTFLAWLQLVHGVPSGQDLFFDAIAEASWAERTSHAGRLLYIVVMYVGLFVLPLALGLAARLPALVRRIHGRRWVGTVIVAILLVAGFGTFGRERLMPAAAQFFAAWGLGPNDLIGLRPIVLPEPALLALTIACGASVLLIGLAFSGRSPMPAAVQMLLAIGGLQVIASTLASFNFMESFLVLDRYLLPLAPFALAVLAWLVKDLALPWQPVLAVLAVVAAFSVAGVHDHLMFQSRVWGLARDANASGIANRNLDAGVAWDGYHLYQEDSTIEPRTTDGPWWTSFYAPATDSRYVIAQTAELDGHQVVTEWDVETWLSPEPAKVYLLRREQAVSTR